MYPNKSPTVCSFDFVFRKYKQDSAFRLSGVLQLSKIGSPARKNFPLLRLFPSDEGPEGVKWEWDWPKIWVGKWDLIHWDWDFRTGNGTQNTKWEWEFCFNPLSKRDNF